MSYAYEKGIGNPSGQQPLTEGATAATVYLYRPSK
jgi:hypothetical protein